MSQIQRFFIALLPPETVQTEAKTIQQYFSDRYDSKAAQKSPPHITLQPPFTWATAALPPLEQQLHQFAGTRSPLPITLQGFAAFPPRVIYINVDRSPALLDLQTALSDFMAAQCNILDPQATTRPFMPHITVAFRDLTQQNFQLAWPEFAQRSFQATFAISELTLLVHDGQQWQIARQFPLGSE